MTTIRQQLRFATLPDGRRAGIIDSIIPDDAPEAVREGLARRALVKQGQDCPCGASWPRPNRAQRRKLDRVEYLSIEVAHADGCPAETETLVAAVRTWKATR